MSAARSHRGSTPANVIPMPQKPAQPFLLVWRRALLGSSLPSTTRHLLLTLSVYMDGEGLCWPNVEELIEATGLSKPTVTKHAQAAEEAGWITTAHVGTGQGWRSKSYRAALPKGADVVKEVNRVAKEVNHVAPERGKADTSNVVKEVNTNSPLNSPRDEGGGARGRERNGTDLSSLPDSALVYRSQIEAYLDADTEERARQARAALFAGMTPGRAFADAIRAAHERAGPAGLAAAVVITANEAESKSHKSRLKYFNSVTESLSDHARRQTIGTDAAPAAKHRGNARQRAYDAKQDPAAAYDRISKAVDDALGL